MKTDTKTGGFSSLGEFAVAARKHIDGVSRNSRLDEWAQKTMTEGTDSSGGFVVPEQFADEIRDYGLEGAIVRPRATVLPMVRDTVNIPVLEDSDRSSSIFGGVTFTWLEETGAKHYDTVASKPVISYLKLTAHEGVATTFVQNALEDDYEKEPKKFGDFITLAFGRACRFYEDYYFINGNGVGQPLGALNSPGIIEIARSGVDGINLVDFGNMAARLIPSSWPTAVWLINQTALAQLLDMQGTTANQASFFDVGSNTILGRPVLITEKLAAMGSENDVLLADFMNGYVIGDRQLEIAGSRHVDYSANNQGFLQNQTFWKVVLRCDGQPVLKTAITPNQGGSTLSHFVVLTSTS